MKHILRFLGLFLVIGVVLTITVWAAGELLPRHVTSSGGGTQLTGGGYVLHGALGQPVAGTVGSSSYRLCSGFWCGGVPEIVEDKYSIYLPLVIRNYSIDDTCPGRGPLVLGRPYRERIDYEKDEDWFFFEATAGVDYTIQTSELGANVDTVLELYDVNCGRRLADNDDINYPENLASRIEWQAPSNGAYHIKIYHSTREIAYGPDNKYTLTITTE